MLVLVAWKGIGGGREVMGVSKHTVSNFLSIHYLAAEMEHACSSEKINKVGS